MAFDVIEVARAFRTRALQFDLQSALNSKLYIASVPPNVEAPYGLIDVISVNVWDTFDAEGFEIRLQVTLMATDASGAVTASAMAKYLRTNVSRKSLTVTGLEITGIDRDSERGPFRDDKLWRSDCDYIIRGLESS